MRRDILDLTRHAAKLNLHPVYGSTGTLITKKLARQIIDAGGVAVSISLHMLDKKKLNEFTGSPSYDLAIQAMKNCKEVGLPLPFRVKWQAPQPGFHPDPLCSVRGKCIYGCPPSFSLSPPGYPVPGSINSC